MSEGQPALPVELEDRLWAVFDLPISARRDAVAALAADYPLYGVRLLDLWHSMEGTLLPPAPPGPKQIGPYHLLRELGQGGMGQVFLAERREPVHQLLAIKLIKPERASPRSIRMFHEERRVIAGMQHDAIARAYDFGATDGGQLFFAMEYVDGVPITTYCDQRRLSIEQRIALFQRVCAGVQHAHGKGVVHRDLKPSNILVAEVDGVATPKVIDFGVAKAVTGSEGADGTLAFGAVGTHLYMAPEQADPQRPAIDARADVYSLGVVLHELLAGVLPFTDRDLRTLGATGFHRFLREVVTPRPSARLSSTPGLAGSIARARRVSAAVLRRTLGRELDWVVLRAMAKERGARYDSVEALARDLRRFLQHEPLHSRPRTAGYLVRKLAQRQRGLVSACTAIAAIATLSWVAVSASMAKARKACELARDSDLEVVAIRAEIESARRHMAESANRTAIALAIHLRPRGLPNGIPALEQAKSELRDLLQTLIVRAHPISASEAATMKLRMLEDASASPSAPGAPGDIPSFAIPCDCFDHRACVAQAIDGDDMALKTVALRYGRLQFDDSQDNVIQSICAGLLAESFDMPFPPVRSKLKDG